MNLIYPQVNCDNLPTKLYVVGNGFDLWHGIPSAYRNFKEFVRQRDSEIFNAVENYIPAGDDWSSLESALAATDVDAIIDDLGHFMCSYADDDWSDSSHYDFQYEVGKVVSLLSKQLIELFGEWIRSLPIPTPETAQRSLREIDLDAAFFTFNYTSTLQELYSIPDNQILHIHGEARVPFDELVLGHAWNPKIRKSLNDSSDVEDFDTRLMEAHEILDEYFLKTFKPSEKLILDNQAFFNRLRAIDTVHVLGHSLSDVDLPYLKALLRIPAVAGARWYVACRDDDERQKKIERLIEVGVDGKNAISNLWSDYL